MVRASAIGAEGPKFEACTRDFSKALRVHLAGNGHSHGFFRGGEGNGGEEGEWCPTSVTTLPVQIGSNSYSPTRPQAII